MGQSIPIDNINKNNKNMKTLKIFGIPMYIGWVIIIGMLLRPIITIDTESIVFLFTRTHFPWVLGSVVVYTILLLVLQSYSKKTELTAKAQ